MLAKLSIVEEETDESLYWLEILVEAHLVSAQAVEGLVREAGELLAMTVASKKTPKLRVEAAKRPPANRQSTIGNRQS
jgi:four helix bundle protein